MKKFILGAAATLLALGVGACAQKTNRVYLTGEPVVIERSGTAYVAPSNLVMAREGYYYVTVNNQRRVCYLTEQPGLANLNFLVLNVSVGGTQQRLVCYHASREYFVIRD